MSRSAGGPRRLCLSMSRRKTEIESAEPCLVVNGVTKKLLSKKGTNNL